MNTNGISAARANAAYALQSTKPVAKDGDNDGSKSAKPSASFGPAVVLSLTNTMATKAPDAAQGDPDNDGK